MYLLLTVPDVRSLKRARPLETLYNLPSNFTIVNCLIYLTRAISFGECVLLPPVGCTFLSIYTLSPKYHQSGQLLSAHYCLGEKGRSFLFIFIHKQLFLNNYLNRQASDISVFKCKCPSYSYPVFSQPQVIKLFSTWTLALVT